LSQQSQAKNRRRGAPHTSFHRQGNSRSSTFCRKHPQRLPPSARTGILNAQASPGSSAAIRRTVDRTARVANPTHHRTRRCRAGRPAPRSGPSRGGSPCRRNQHRRHRAPWVGRVRAVAQPRARFRAKRLKGFEPSTFCMAIRPVSETGGRRTSLLAGVSQRRSRGPRPRIRADVRRYAAIWELRRRSARKSRSWFDPPQADHPTQGEASV
jgi:hypothetical protein